jgi:uncharacterized protein (UPF0548 family)
VHRWELAGSVSKDSPPAWPSGVDDEDVQPAEDGVGPLFHRLYRTRIAAARMSPEQLVGRIATDLDAVAPSGFARFEKVRGEAGRLRVGDEYVVRMPGPWDGPVRVVASTPTSFRLATLDGHLEAGQVELRATADHRSVEFAIESWARSGDALSDLLYTRLRMAKEVQLFMWTSMLEQVVTLAGGEMDGGIRVITRHVAPAAHDDEGGTGPADARTLRRLAELARRPLNFDPRSVAPLAPDSGWHLDDMAVALPREQPGPPARGGTWEITRELMCDYQTADPASVRATYRRSAPLAGRDMLLQIRFAGLRFAVGVRVGDVYDEDREVDGRPVRVFGWDYKTLEGHFEQGQMHYEVSKWLDSGEVEFRLHAYSRVADRGPALLRLGFRLVGRRRQLRFYRQTCRRVRRLTEGELVA